MELPTRMGERFTLAELIGRGTCSSVFRARDELLDRDVAVKIFPVTDDPRVAREVHLLASLDHPALVPVYDLGVVDGRAFVVMSLFEGGNLADRLTAGGPLPLGQALLAAAAVADALAHVHRAGVLHRDVIPRNVLFDADGRAHLSDFGVALVADAPRITDTGIVVGSAPYLAPEQVRGEAVGPTADIYSLGLVTIEALTGRPAYEGTPLEAAQARLEHPPTVPAGLPDEVTKLIGVMTAEDPAARPDGETVCRRMRQVALALEVAADDPRTDLPVGFAADLTAVTPRGEGTRRRIGRGSMVLAAATLSIMLASGVVIASTGPVGTVAATMPPGAGLAAPTLAVPAPVTPFAVGFDGGDDEEVTASTERSEGSGDRDRGSGSDSGSTVVAAAPRTASTSEDADEAGTQAVRPAVPPRPIASDTEPEPETTTPSTSTTSESAPPSTTTPETTTPETTTTSRSDESDQESNQGREREEERSAPSTTTPTTSKTSPATTSDGDEPSGATGGRDESDQDDPGGRSGPADDTPRRTGLLEALGRQGSGILGR